MFHRFPEIPRSFGDYKRPEQLTELINTKRYSNAAECLIRHNIPFNYCFIFLSNSPEALAQYLYLNITELEDDDVYEGDGEEEEDKTEKDKNNEEQNPDAGEENAEAENKTDEPESQDTDEPLPPKPERTRNFSPRSVIFINLYLNIAVPLLLAKSGAELRNGIQFIVDFVKKCKVGVEKYELYKISREISNDDLSRELYHIFGDIWDYSMLLFEEGKYDEIFKELASLDRQKRAQVLMNFPVNYQIKMMKSWTKGPLKLDGESILPLAVHTTFQSPLKTELAEPMAIVLDRMMLSRTLATPPERQIYFILLTALHQNRNPIYNHDTFRDIGYDYVIRYLRRRHGYVVAAEFCAHIPTRHYAAVSYALETSLDETVKLLALLEGKPDHRDCWLRALERASRDNVEWTNFLLAAAKSNVVALDDIFPLMPPNMTMEGLQDTLVYSITGYQNRSTESKAKIQAYIDRSDSQRALISKGPSMVAQLEPIASCWICNQLIYDDRFLVFPCMHTVHVSCLLSNMHLYYSPTMRLNLVSLAARAMRGENNISGLSDQITKSCPVCGTLSTKVLNKGFVMKNETSDREMWELPDPFGPKEEPDQSEAAH